MRALHLASEWLYGALLHLYPKAFRAAYGRQMRLTFRDACRAASRRHGAGGLLALWLPTLLDLFKSALEEQARQGVLMLSKTRLIALAGPLTVAVGALWLTSALGDFAFQTGLVTDEAWVGIVALPFFFAFVPMLFALLGIRLRFHATAGGLGRLGLAVSVAGCAGVLMTVLVGPLLGGATPEGAPPAWLSATAAACALAIRAGLLLFGVEALQHKPLPRWNALPLLLGATVVLSLPFEWFGAPALLPLPGVTPFLHFALSGAGWVWLGLALMAPHQTPQTALTP